MKSFLGVDIGSAFSKAVLFSGGSILSWAIVPSAGNYRQVADEVMKEALNRAGISHRDIAGITATGYGAGSVTGAGQSASDISCQGRGVAYLLPSARTVIDIGAQFTRAFRVDSGGRVINFLFSEKCAGGSGRLLQVIARVLQVELGEMGEMSLKSTRRVDFNTGCAVFTESEVISRIAEGEAREDIAAGVNRALAAKARGLVERLKLEPDCAVVGGGAKNPGLVKSIEESLGVKVLVPEEPQIVAALGASIATVEPAKMSKGR